MEELRNLNELAKQVVKKFNEKFDARDCVIPQAFKDKVKRLKSFSVVYNKYSVVIKGDGVRSKDSYVPNQSFFMASFFIEYSYELSRYKQKIMPWISDAGITTNDLTAFFTHERDKGKEDIKRNEDRFVGILNSIGYSGLDRDFLIKFVTDYDWWSGSKTIDRSDFFNSPVLSIMGLTASSNAAMALIVDHLTQNPGLSDLLLNQINSDVNNMGNGNLQQIFYGAPGTGKSNTIKREVDEKELPCIRTTFHPDSDYSTFVGAYKPIMEDIDVKVTPVVVENGISLQPSGTYKERRIAYKFVKQAFLKAYLGAWKKYVDSGSIGNTYTSNEFDTGNGRYVINSVGVYDLNLSKEFTFPKSLVSKEWDNLWNNGIFNVPKGQQSGKSVQHAIASWITNKIDDCDKDKFEEGWQKLSDTIREKGRVEVRKFVDKKSQTYIICKISDDNETLTINVEAQGKRKSTLRPKFDGDKTNASKLEKALIGILKENDTDFDVAWDTLKKKVDEGISPEVKDDSDGYIVPQFLVIEEINRGNCAQIFGDIFQLLDRQENGFSEYPIEADTDIQNAIKTAFEEEKEYKLESGIDVDFAVENYTSNYDANATLSEDLQAGRVMLLPPNLYIWATMNTSDQSLFPIDSAFKRRWDWKYIPINTRKEQWFIEAEKTKYSWSAFLETINTIIYDKTSSEDKQLGFYFCKANGDTISAETFVSKVIFYLWNDVFKDYGFDGEYFADPEGGTLEFRKFFNFDGTINEKKVTAFMKNLKIDVEEEKNNNTSDLMITYEGENIEGKYAIDKFLEVIKRVVADKGAEAVNDCLQSSEFTQSPDKGTTREYEEINGTGWYIPTNIGKDKMRIHLSKLKNNLGINIVFS